MSCRLTWDGDPSMPVAWLTFGPGISQIRAAGGDVIPSFGGYTADHGWTDIADSCTSTRAVAKAYEKVITTYHVTGSISTSRTTHSRGPPPSIAGTRRFISSSGGRPDTIGSPSSSTRCPRRQAAWARTVSRVLRSAKRHHARIKVVNIMTFDYYDGGHHEMADDTKSAARALVGQLHQIHLHMSTAERWAKVRITEMIGIDDFGPAETFTVADAKAVKRWAASKNLAELSFWGTPAGQRELPWHRRQRQLLRTGPVALAV
jgi:hypothetical protein